MVEGKCALKAEPIVAVAFLTDANLKAIGSNLKRVYPVSEIAPFEDLLRAIDDATMNTCPASSQKVYPCDD